MSEPTLLRYSVQIFDNLLSEPVRFWGMPSWFDVFPFLAKALSLQEGKQIVVVKDYETDTRCAVELVDGAWQGRAL